MTSSLTVRKDESVKLSASVDRILIDASHWHKRNDDEDRTGRQMTT